MVRIHLETPISERQARKLKVGDIIYISGLLVTARDAAHRRIIQHLKEGKSLPFSLDGLPLFHCGPLVRKVNDEWKVLTAGPTTSMRMELFEDEIIKSLNVRLIIGKGGMGEKTRRALMEFGAAYGVFTGGAGVLAAGRIKKVKNVEWLDLGIPEAVWVFEVGSFGPIIISIDSYGNSLFDMVQYEAKKRMEEIVKNFKS
jgi:fumarate hydratase subunit beta